MRRQPRKSNTKSVRIISTYLYVLLRFFHPHLLGNEQEIDPDLDNPDIKNPSGNGKNALADIAGTKEEGGNEDEDEAFGNELENDLGEDTKQKQLNQKVSFPIKDGMSTRVKEKAKEHNFPMMEEYDFHHDPFNRSFRIHLSSSTHLRPYQERCLNKMFGNSRARSGLIVLPCGAVSSMI